MWFKRIKNNIESNKELILNVDERVETEIEELRKEIKSLRAEIVEINELVASVKFLTVEAKRKEKTQKIDKWLSSYPDESDKYSVGGNK